MNEYNCWLQAGIELPVGDKLLRKEDLGRPLMLEKGPLVEQALREYCRGIARLGITADSGAGGAAANAAGVRIGTIPVLNKESGLGLREQKAEGFVLRILDHGAIIAGQDGAGALYGVYRFLSLAALGKLHAGEEITGAPAAPLRMINHWDNLDGSIERGYAGLSLFFKDNRIHYDKQRIEDYARLLASLGINRISLNNVNVRGTAKLLITDEYLPDLAAVAEIFRPFGIRILISIFFSSPSAIGGLATFDPLDSAVAAWWQERANLVYRYIPDLAGFLVKADSEGEKGPFEYGRSHADGANMLAAALKPHNGIVVWRCFVYNAAQNWRDQKIDRARAAYDHFKPQDGSFADNVVLQIKHGPYDFQIREPVSPLFGALPKTRHVMELQVTQEYTGHQIDLCFLPSMWAGVMDFDTGNGPQSRIKDLIGRSIDGFAGVGNTGLDKNWTGNTLAQANLYGYGRLAWQPDLSPQEIAAEWSALTFGAEKNNSDAAHTVESLLLKSYAVYEKYNAPFGLCFMVNPGHHYGPSPEGYEFSRWGTYHRADAQAIGIDRTPGGTGYTGQYTPANAALFANSATCPENMILFFHRLRYDFKMKNGETLLQNIYDTHFEGCDEVEAMLKTWTSLKGKVDEDCYAGVLARFENQLENAQEWRDVVNTYFWRKTLINDKKGRKIFE
jgi:alpha-glucuronidase